MPIAKPDITPSAPNNKANIKFVARFDGYRLDETHGLADVGTLGMSANHGLRAEAAEQVLPIGQDPIAAIIRQAAYLPFRDRQMK